MYSRVPSEISIDTTALREVGGLLYPMLSDRSLIDISPLVESRAMTSSIISCLVRRTVTLSPFMTALWMNAECLCSTTVKYERSGSVLNTGRSEPLDTMDSTMSGTPVFLASASPNSFK